MGPWFAFAAISLIWGSTWLVHVYALVDFTPLGLATVRFLMAGVICLAIGLRRGEIGPDRKQLPKLLIAGLILLGGANVITAWTLKYIPSGVGAVLQSPIPLWMALLSMRREPLSKWGWIAAVLGLTGVALVLWPGGRLNLNLWIAAICASTCVVWAWAALYQRRHVTSGGMFVNTGLQMLVSGMVGLLITPLSTGFMVHGAVGTDALLALAYLTIFGSIIAFSSFIYLTKVWHPARAGSFAYLNPLVAVWLGVTLNQEPITLKLIVGMMVILCSVALLQWQSVSGARRDALLRKR